MSYNAKVYSYLKAVGTYSCLMSTFYYEIFRVL